MKRTFLNRLIIALTLFAAAYTFNLAWKRAGMPSPNLSYHIKP
jgi:hypothetical protein